MMSGETRADYIDRLSEAVRYCITSAVYCGMGEDAINGAVRNARALWRDALANEPSRLFTEDAVRCDCAICHARGLAKER